MIRRPFAPTLFALAALCAPLLVSAQDATRSNEIGRPSEKDDEVTIGRYVFAGIGIDAYETPDIWKTLDNAVNDVDSMQETLREAFDFDTPDEWVLRNEQATHNAIRHLIDELGQNLQPDDNLIFFYAGHGAERATVFDGEVVSRTGYLVPVGVKAPLEDSPSQYLEIDRLLADLAALPARHVLVILDSCYSGMALEGDFKTRGGPTQQATDLIGRRSRRVLTSAQSDQLAADGGADFPNNSLFTGWLTEGLRRAAGGGADGQATPDANADGMVTVTELFSFVSGRVGAASESRQTPDFGAFKFDNRGELVLMRETDPFDDLYSEAVQAFEEGKFDAFFAATDDALSVETEGARPSYLRYLGARIDDELAGALTALRELSALAEAGEAVPLSAGELMIELRRTERQCQKAGAKQQPETEMRLKTSRLPPSIGAMWFVAVLVVPAHVSSQDRSIFSVLDTQGRSVAASISADGSLSEEDVLSAGGRRVQVWALSTGPGAELQVDLRSADFDAFLYIVGPGLGEGLRDDDGGEGLNSRLCIGSTQSGEYRVVASSLSGGLGAFTLEVSEMPGATDGSCPETSTAAEITDLALLPTDGRILSLGDDIGSFLLDTDPIVFASPAQAWAVEGQAGEPFSVDLISDAFDAYLMVQGPGLDPWLSDDDGAGRCDSRITFVFPQTGTYRVVVSTLDTFGGPFQLIATAQPGPANPDGCVDIIPDAEEEVESRVEEVVDVGALVFERPAAGTMTGDESIYEGRFMQGWTLEGVAGARIAIEMRSASFDSYLFFTGPGFSTPLYDDDGAGNLHSRICVELPTDGSYRVFAGPLSGENAGENYTLTASTSEAESLCESFEISPAVMADRLADLPYEGRSISVGEEHEGFLDITAARHPDTNQRIQAWSFQAQAGQTVYIDVVSDEFDPLLYAIGPGIDGVQFLDDFPGGCNTRMEIVPIVSGTLTLLPGAFYATASGSFLIRASASPGPLEEGGCISADAASSGGISSDRSTIASISSGESRRITVGTEVAGELGPDEELLPTADQPAQAWTVAVEAGDELVFELLSDDFDPVLYLDGPALFSPLMDDDGAGSLNSRIVHTVAESGVMRLVVTALTAGDSGTFRLRVVRRVN